LEVNIIASVQGRLCLINQLKSEWQVDQRWGEQNRINPPGAVGGPGVGLGAAVAVGLGQPKEFFDPAPRPLARVASLPYFVFLIFPF